MRINWRSRRLAVLALALALTALIPLPAPARAAAEPATAAAPPADVLRATLANGLRVVIVRNTLAPVVTTALNYLVGADETPTGFPGMAHAQEHMMFRGGPGLSADQLAELGSIMGGRFNADTRQTVTQYLFTVPAGDLDLALHVEALRMAGIDDEQSTWSKERGAIEQEVAQDLSNSRYVLFTRLRAALFEGTPYAQDALGTRPSFEATTGAMLKTFHDTWYAPNNAVLIVAGDVDPPAALARIRALFGPIPRRALPERPPIRLQPVASRSIALPSDLPYGMQVIALRLPGLASPDWPAIEVLADVLSSERGALYGLVPQGKALYAGFSIDPLPQATLGYAILAFPAGTAPAPLADAARAILTNIARDGVPPDLVAAAKLQERREAEFEKNSIEGLATVWSEAIAVDGLASPDEDLARIEKVSVADVDRVARRYLDLGHAVSATMTPQGSGSPARVKGFGGQETIALGTARTTALPSWASAALQHLAVPPATTHPVVSHLANGITLIVQPETVSDTVSVFGHIRNRPELQVPAGEEGLSQVIDRLFDYGSRNLDRIAFQTALDEIGATESAGSDFAVAALAENFDRATALLADNELHPAFPDKAFAVVRRQVAETVAGRLASPRYLTQRAVRSALYPAGDPMLRQALPKTVEGISPAALRAYYRAAFRPDLTTITVIGRVTPDEAKAVIEKHFGAWTAQGAKPPTELPPVPPNAPATLAVPDASRMQDEVVLAETLGVTRHNPAYYALRLGNTVLGGGLYATRLSRDLRMNAGLVYSVDSDLDVRQTRGIYSIQYACDPKNVARVHAMIVQELAALRQRPVTADELARAKAYLIGQIPLGEASIQGIAAGFLQRADLDLPLDEPSVAARHYLALDAAAVQAAFAASVRPDALIQVSEGPAPE